MLFHVNCYFLTDRRDRFDGSYRTQEVRNTFSTEKESWEHVRSCNAGHCLYQEKTGHKKKAR